MSIIKINYAIFILAGFLLFIVTTSNGAFITNAQDLTERKDILNSIISWSDYVDNETGFSLQYPIGVDWKLHNNNKGEIKILNTGGMNGHKNKFSTNDIKISTYLRENNKQLNIAEWFEALPRESDFGNTVNSIEKVVAKGRNGLRAEITDYFGNKTWIIFVPLEKDKILEIGLTPVNAKTLQVFDRVVHSLEFPTN